MSSIHTMLSSMKHPHNLGGNDIMTYSSAGPVYKEVIGTCLMEIYDRGDTRSLYFGGRFLQSRMSLSAPHILLLPYTQYMMFSLLLTEQLQNVLLIGLGGGSLVRFLHHHFPECTIDAVEHSDHVIKLAKGYFQLPDNSRVRIHCRDGKKFLTDTSLRRQYDLILIDAFDEEGMAAHIYDGRFFQHCAAALPPQGILCCNIWSGIPRTVEIISEDLAGCFNNRLLLPVPNRGNLICIATAAPIQWNRICRQRRELLHLQARFHLDFPKLVKVALQHNMSVSQRLLNFFSF